MTALTISQVARRVGLRPSAIRYYEQLGIVAPPARVSGQRRYDDAALSRLMVVRRARALGFSLPEIRHLFFEFPDGTPAARRWGELARLKLEQVHGLMAALTEQAATLERQGECGCATLEECGRCMLDAV
ncbi:MAG TPA: MerR family transcriptional regulator [Gemmatimonadaceae bacterium]|nr:MerR family transcriptional regulator [Gemmatimonadaceae bacterium]